MKYGPWLLLIGCGDPAAVPDAGPRDAPVDVSWVHVDDGTPTRQQCTNNLGTGLGSQFGRMDGFLVAIVPPGNGGCNADPDHVHLQVRMSGAIYDVAVDIGGMGGVQDVHTTTRELVMPGPAWSEGFHASVPTDYVALGVHAASLTLETRQMLASEIMTDLASANHVSIYAIPYGPTGAHLVHRNGSGRDGMIVTQPLSTPSHLRMFSFTSQNF